MTTSVSAWPAPLVETLRGGMVIPAHLLALDATRRLDRHRQRALSRYYIDAGSGGLAIGVHSTQFAIREAGLYEPVLKLAAEEAAAWGKRPLLLIAGLVGKTDQAKREAETAASLGYHAGLLSLAAMRGASEDELIAHCRAVAHTIPLVGFYLQPAVGGIALSQGFWRRFAEIEEVVAIKIAPFNRYRTFDVIRGVVAARAERARHPLYRQRRRDRPGSGRALHHPPGRRNRECAHQGRPARPLERLDPARRRASRAHPPGGRKRPDRHRAACAGQCHHRLQQRVSSIPRTISAAASPAATRCCAGKACSRGSGALIRRRG